MADTTSGNTPKKPSNTQQTTTTSPSSTSQPVAANSLDAGKPKATTKVTKTRQTRAQPVKPATDTAATHSYSDKASASFGQSSSVAENLSTSKDEVYATVMREMIAEQRARRRWGLAFKSVTVLLFVGFIYAIASIDVPDALGFSSHQSWSALGDQPFIAAVEVKGVIDEQRQANAKDLIDNVRAAFADQNSKGVLLDINSPGGSPVQASQVYNALREIRKQHPNKPLYAVISDVGASGAYYIAAAADKIYASRSSIVGSIGVIASGFGFDKLIADFGIQRRIYTAGNNKMFTDSFLPESMENVAYLQSMLDDIHQVFIQSVLATRQEKIKNQETVFSGLPFSGVRGMQLGLIDGYGSMEEVAQQQFGIDNIVYFQQDTSNFEHILNYIGEASYRAISNAISQPVIR